MLKTILVIAVLLLVAVLIYAATKPDTFLLQRSIAINAPPEKVFSFINDFHHWPSWSPWEKMDPAMKKTHSGSSQGLGAIYEWEGNSQVGQGRMEILESSPPAKVGIKLDFFKPFEAHNRAEFTMEGKGETTKVTWAMSGLQPYVAKVMSLFFSMERMVGPQFESGLANLKALAER